MSGMRFLIMNPPGHRKPKVRPCPICGMGVGYNTSLKSYGCNTTNCVRFSAHDAAAGKAAWDHWAAQVRGVVVSKKTGKKISYRSKPMSYNIPKPVQASTDDAVADDAGSFTFDEDPVAINMVLDARTKQPVTCPVCERVIAEFSFDGGRVALGCTGGCFVTAIGESHQCWIALREWTDGRVAAGAVAATRTDDELDADAEQLAVRLEAAKLRLVKPVKGGG